MPNPEESDPKSEADEDVEVKESFGQEAKISRRTPYTATAAERDAHEASGHATYRAWCGPCV